MAGRKLSIKETLGELSERWCARNNFPSGLYLTMINSHNRQRRSDTVINRRALPDKARDNSRLSSAFDELQDIFVTDVGQRKFTLALRKPNEENIPRNTMIRTIRRMDIEGEFPTPEVADPGLKRCEREEHIAVAPLQVAGMIFSCIEGEGIEEEIAAQDAIEAILEVIDRPTLLKALEEAGLLKGR